MAFDLSEENEILKECYKLDNFESTSGSANICVIYFSSNGLYFPNEESVFKETIIEKNRYEWKEIRYRNSNYTVKEIWVRDIYKQWYVTGINENINSIDDLSILLRNMTNGCDEIITIGSSAGGYASALLGCLLGATRVFCFSGQFNLNSVVDDCFYLKKYKKEHKYSKYYDIVDIISESNTKIYYFYPRKVEADQEQANYIKQCINVKTFAFNSNVHGQTMYKCNISSILGMDDILLEVLFEKYKNKKISPFEFSVRISGITETIKYYTKLKLRSIYHRFKK